jgi:hypothetical protein
VLRTLYERQFDRKKFALFFRGFSFQTLHAQPVSEHTNCTPDQHSPKSESETIAPAGKRGTALA